MTNLPDYQISEVYLRADLDEPRLEDQVRHLPDRLAARNRSVPVVLPGDGVHVERVVDVEADERPRPSSPEDLRELDVELVQPTAFSSPGSMM